MNQPKQDDDSDPRPRSGVPNLKLGFILVGLVVLWFVFGVVYVAFIFQG